MAKQSIVAREANRKYKIRVRNRCQKCGRPRGYIRRFGLCRGTGSQRQCQQQQAGQRQQRSVQCGQRHGASGVRVNIFIGSGPYHRSRTAG